MISCKPKLAVGMGGYLKGSAVVDVIPVIGKQRPARKAFTYVVVFVG
jgi:hypothetical protein